MKEIVTFWMYPTYFNALKGVTKSRFNGAMYIVKVEKGDSVYKQIEYLKNHTKDFIYSYSGIERKYTEEELSNARLFSVSIKKQFEPIGEECGTIYDETPACPICGSGRIQVGQLHLQKRHICIPKYDIASSIVSEIVCSENFKDRCLENRIRGIQFSPIISNGKEADIFQPKVQSPLLKIAKETVTGLDLFSDMDSQDGRSVDICGYKIDFPKVVFRCPKGDLIGAKVLSEVYVEDSPVIDVWDVFETLQYIGSKSGVYRPVRLLLCSKRFYRMVIDNGLKGFEFEVAHIV